MSVPIIAIVGRPNVGKSTLFNRLLRGRKAIVDDTPGVTRDRLYGEFDWRGRHFILVDTGGFEADPIGIMAQVRAQAEQAVAEADVILLLVDAKDGLTPADAEVAGLLRKAARRPILLVVNKVDAASQETLAAEFHRLGFEPVFPVSAEQGQGIGELLDAVASQVPEAEAPPQEPGAVTVAVIGRPNVGKSSLVNRFLGADRVLVSPEPGTTRDAVDTRFSYRGRDYILVDTAGIRAKGRIGRSVERYSVSRALAAVRRADVALILLDAVEGVTAAGHQDRRRGARGGLRQHPGREQVGPAGGGARRGRGVPPCPAGEIQVSCLRARRLRLRPDGASGDAAVPADRRGGSGAGAPDPDAGVEYRHPGGRDPPPAARRAGPPGADPLRDAGRREAAHLPLLRHGGQPPAFLLSALPRELLA